MHSFYIIWRTLTAGCEFNYFVTGSTEIQLFKQHDFKELSSFCFYSFVTPTPTPTEHYYFIMATFLSQEELYGGESSWINASSNVKQRLWKHKKYTIWFFTEKKKPLTCVKMQATNVSMLTAAGESESVCKLCMQISF